MDVPADLRRYWSYYWPAEDIDALAADVTARLHAAASRWQLTGLRPLDGGMVCLVAAADSPDHGPVVCKAGPRPRTPRRFVEAPAMAAWTDAGAPVAQVLGVADDGATLLLERVTPGATLHDAGLTFEQTARQLANLHAALHGAVTGPPAGVPSLAGCRQIAEVRDALTGDPQATATLDRLLAASVPAGLLHLDLHPRNVLRGAGAWKVIDPHGAFGDRAADVRGLIDLFVLFPGRAGDVGDVLKLLAAADGTDPERLACWLSVWCQAIVAEARAHGGEDPDQLAWQQLNEQLLGQLG